jgi:hypothetical protein
MNLTSRLAEERARRRIGGQHGARLGDPSASAMTLNAPSAAATRDRFREGLARWFESISDEADYAASRAPFSIRAVAPVQPLLDEVAEALRGADPGVRGVLRAQRLLEQGGSPLYGHDADALRRELQVIRLLLEI